MKRPYSPLAVANWFIHHDEARSTPLDPMKLIKLVYLSHGWHLAVRGEPLINENVEAWQYGPVIPSVYHAFKRFGARPVDRPGREVTGTGIEEPRIEPEDASTQAVLERVWDVYGKFTGIQLSTLTHKPGSPWEHIWNEAQKQGKVRGVDIPDDLIRRHFVEIAQGNQAGDG